MKKGVVAALAIAAAVIANPAVAEDKGLFLGASVGHSQYQDACQNIALPCTDDTTNYRAFAGYQFHRNFAAEVGYGLVGRAQGQGDFGGGTASFKQQAYAWDVSILGSFEIVNRVWAFARLGAYSARTTLEQEGTSFGQVNDADSQTGVVYGLGIGYHFSHFGVRAEWQRYGNIGNNNFGHDDVDVFNLAAMIRF